MGKAHGPRRPMKRERPSSGDPDDPDALRILARSWVRLGRDDAALAIYTRRLPEGEIEAEDDLLLGTLYERRGKKEAALRSWEKVLEAVDVSGQSLDELGRLHLKGHRREEAARVVERLGRQKGWEARAAMMLGTIRAGLDDVPGAAESFRRALLIDPAEVDRSGDPKAHRLLIARTFLRTGNPVEARAMVEPVLAQGPDQEASWLLSRAYLQEGTEDRARAALAGGRVLPRRERPGGRAFGPTWENRAASRAIRPSSATRSPAGTRRAIIEAPSSWISPAPTVPCPTPTIPV